MADIELHLVDDIACHDDAHPARELWALPVRESKSADVHPGVVFVSEIPSPLASLPLLVLSAIAMVIVHHQNASGGDNELAWAHACARGVARGSHGRDTHPRASRPRSIGVSWTITRKAKSRVLRAKRIQSRARAVPPRLPVWRQRVRGDLAA